MQEFLENLWEALVNFVTGITAVSLFLLFITSPFWSMHVVHHLNKAESIVYIDGKVVYEGPNHFVSVDSSQYNSTKEVRIYEDVYKLSLVARYISNDVKVESK